LDAARIVAETADVTSTTSPRPVLAWDEPDGLAPRGTLILLTGRGETPSVYGRVGRRLAADAYRVRVVATQLDDLDATRSDVLALLADDELPSPRILAGSDAGAAYAAVLAGELDVDALIVAGLATAPIDERSWEDELDARTACPAHRGVLSGDAESGRLADELPEALRERPAPPIPTLVIHGAADPVTAPELAFAAFPTAEAVLIAGGRHDILNDVTHRSVAATIVLFLERLRLGRELPEIVTSP
jgi:alpha-beta hydrolase superfamily lysophospholipase